MFSLLWMVAPGSRDGAMTSEPDEPVRGNACTFGIAALSWLTSAASVPSIPAALTVAGNSARIAAMSVVGSWTSHCSSCALDGNVCSFPSLPVLAYESRKRAACAING